jgi:glycosyltransferase involved in cell wall biosynthesis
MMAEVDMVVVVSKNLYEAKRPFHPNTYLVANGVNYQAYSEALTNPMLPAELEAIKSPRLGYVGLIGDKLNFEMLIELARQHPHWSLVLLGEVRVVQQMETWQTLRALPNVHVLGPVDVSQVPHYVKGFQVGLMPYLQNRHAENINPLKLYDYLAAAVPVASVDIPALQEFSRYIYLAANAQQFSQAVEAALANTSSEHRQAYRNLAAQHTWEARVEQLSELIQKQLSPKKSCMIPRLSLVE